MSSISLRYHQHLQVTLPQQCIKTLLILDRQRQISKDLYNLISAAAPNLSDLNSTPTLATASALIPETCQVQLVYGLTFESSTIGTSSPLDDKILATAA